VTANTPAGGKVSSHRVLAREHEARGKDLSTLEALNYPPLGKSRERKAKNVGSEA